MYMCIYTPYTPYIYMYAPYSSYTYIQPYTAWGIWFVEYLYRFGQAFQFFDIKHGNVFLALAEESSGFGRPFRHRQFLMPGNMMQ